VTRETIAFIGLGSNVGDRAAHIAGAIAALGATAGIVVERVSEPIETDPVGPPGQGPYLNAAARLRTTLDPPALLEVLLDIERGHGRDRTAEVRWGPRTLDLDLLLHGPLVLDEPGLTIPHPRMHERDFVLRPLADVGPDAVHPGRGRTVRELLADLTGALPESE
jgi:2-amino-4-hydroxy-6-hydroxymethyldihydropteridine diphosphokinase